MKAVDYLTEGRELISDFESWTTGVLARDKDGEEVPPQSANATCWCSEGALECVYWRSSETLNRAPYREAMYILACVVKEEIDISGSSKFILISYNDNSSHDRVLSLWDKAIAKAEEFSLWDKAMRRAKGFAV